MRRIVAFLTVLSFFWNPIRVKADETIEILAPSAVVMDANTGLILFDKNKDERHYPASVTKLMTVLLTLEEVEKNSDVSFSQRIPFSHDSVFSLPHDSSGIAMDEGETLSLDEALYAILLASANEVSNAVAEYMGGDIETFARLMTERAKELGAENTNFTNPHGLHDERHYTTVYDMALIMRENLTRQKFKDMISTARYDIPHTEKQPQPRVMNNSHRMISRYSDYYNPDVVGGKTGFTSEAKHTLATYGQRGSAGVIVVVMAEETSANAYEDTNALLDYWLDQYETVTFLKEGEFKRTVPVVSLKDGVEATEDVVEASNANDVVASVPGFVKSLVALEVELPGEFNRPVNEGEKVGYLYFTYQDVKIAEADVEALNGAGFASEAKDASATKTFITPTAMNIFKTILAVIVVLLIIRAALTALQRRARRTLRYRLQKARPVSYRYRNGRF
ncbi:MAG: D-alanyl-D-alanine carboxypeptidase [Clostridiales bacterium]|jgi:D-alanyl-D-alanine carboxypeptidase|nr:D-alanyl-D-alanine carboxypeptidase [Clostridiales bacterium]